LNKINPSGDDKLNASIVHENRNFETVRNPSLKDKWIGNDTSSKQIEAESNEDPDNKISISKNSSLRNISGNMIERSASNLDINPSVTIKNNSIISNNNKIPYFSNKIINTNNNIELSFYHNTNGMNKTAILNPSNFKKTDAIKIEEIRTIHMNSLFMSEEQISKKTNLNKNLVGLMNNSFNTNIKSESENKIKSVLITNYFEKVLLVYSTANKFFLHDMETDTLYYQSELSEEDIINNIFYYKILGIPILIIIGKKKCIFWDILTKQTLWKFATDHFNFDRLILIDLESDLLGANPASPLSDETKVYVESYINNLNFETYLENLSVVLWQSEYSGYFPFEYFYSDAVFQNKKRKLFDESNVNSDNIMKNRFSKIQENSLKENKQYGCIDKWVNKKGVLHIVCGSPGKIIFYKYNSEIPESSSLDRFNELGKNRKNYLLINMPVAFSISIEGFYTGMFKYFFNNRNIFYFITYSGNLEKICIQEKFENIPFMDFKLEILKSNKYNGLFKIFEWSWEYCFLYGERVLYVYSLVEDIVVKTLKTNDEILKLIRFQHSQFGDCVGIVYITGNVDILHS